MATPWWPICNRRKKADFDMSSQPSPEQAKQLQDLMHRGFQALSRGKLEEAGKCCQEALQIKPDLVQAHFLVGLTALEAKDRTTAFSAFQSVVKLDKDHAAAWAQLARMYMHCLLYTSPSPRDA